MTALDPLRIRLRELIEEARPPTGGISLTEVAAQTAPVLPLLIELPKADTAALQDFEDFEFRECLTVLTLLGRRLALLDLTPSAAVCVVQLALRAALEAREQDDWDFCDRAVAAAVEGFVLGREERVAQQHGARAAACLRPLQIEPQIWALIPSGEHDAEALTKCVDALGRAILESGATVALVDVTQLRRGDRDTVIALFSADETLRMLGGSCLFCGLDENWRAAAREAHIDLSDLLIAESLGEGLRMAARLARPRGLRTGAFRAFVDRLRGQLGDAR